MFSRPLKLWKMWTLAVTTFLGLGIFLTPGARASFQACVHRIVSCAGVGWWVTQDGTGSAIKAELNNANSNTAALIGTTNGSGPAGYFSSTNTNNGISTFGLDVEYSGQGSAAVFNNLNTNSQAAVAAQSSGSGDGITGSSNSAIGVSGHSHTSIGIQGSTDAIVGGIGVKGLGGYYGVLGITNADSAQAVTGRDTYSGNTGFAVVGESNNGTGVYGSGPVNAGQFDGNVQATSYSTSSDARLKTDITTITSPLDKVMALQGVSFQWKKEAFPSTRLSKTRHLGFVAQDVEKILPELVTKDRKGMRAVSYDGVIPVLVEAIKEQQKEIDTLKGRLKVQKSATNTSQ